MRGAAALVSVVTTILALSGCASPHTLPAQVLRVKGEARYSTDGRTWASVRRGELPPGSIIQTGENSCVKLQLAPLSPELEDERKYASGTLYQPQVDPRDVLLISSNSVVNIEELMFWEPWRKHNSNQIVKHVCLDLRIGRVVGFATRASDTSTYQVRFPDGIVRVDQATYVLNSSGRVDVFEGKLIISFLDREQTVEVRGGHRYDPRSGEVTLLTNKDMNEEISTTPFPDIPEPEAPSIPTRPFSLPQRRF